MIYKYYITLCYDPKRRQTSLKLRLGSSEAVEHAKFANPLNLQTCKICKPFNHLVNYLVTTDKLVKYDQRPLPIQLSFAG